MWCSPTRRGRPHGGSLGEERPCRQGLGALWHTAGTAVALDDEAIGAATGLKGLMG
ncbi:hypothetical protein ABZ851_12045 [Streptomyces sp. NPDC047049]|uniref:hypothetical protein n=1 Tax=Streptomyces sp. NPDC047049 TaxID=3156688 RepID=UPI0033C8F60C